MVGEGGAADEQPRHQLREVPHHNEKGLGRVLGEGVDGEGAEGQIEDHAQYHERQVPGADIGLQRGVQDAVHLDKGRHRPCGGDEEEGRLGPLAAEGLGCAGQNGQQARPGDHRVIEGGKGALEPL